jgi:serine/threonine-protein kinase RIM15
MDSYRKFKADKIRAEAQNALDQTAITSQPSQYEISPKTQDNVAPRASGTVIAARSEDGHSGISNVIDLSPTTSRDKFVSPPSRPRRSISVRSNLSALDSKLSPKAKREKLVDKLRLPSGASSRSYSEAAGAVKRKKNLVNKMEGWWNAVKSNFTADSLTESSRSRYHSTAQRRIPSAPHSRRESMLPPSILPAAQPSFFASESMRRGSSNAHTLHHATSHGELRRIPSYGDHLQASDSPRSTSGDLAGMPRVDAPEIDSLTSPGYAIDEQECIPLSQRAASGLETRRNQPHLRLELEPLTLGSMARDGTRSNQLIDSQGQDQSHNVASAMLHRVSGPSLSRSSSSSYGNPGPGLTPGVPKWDQTPSPIFALGSGSKQETPTAPGAHSTIANVRRHVKHRLAAAKETCDHTLKRTVDAIAVYAEERRTSVDALDDQLRGHGEVLSDSPLVDEESDGDGDEQRRARGGEYQ